MRRGRSAIPIALFFILCALALGSAAWQVLESRSALRGAALEEQASTADLLARAVGQELRRYLDVTEAIAHRPSMVDQLTRGDWRQTAVHLNDLRRIVPAFSHAGVLDRSGTLRHIDPADPSITGRDFALRDYFTGALGAEHAYRSEAFVHSSALPAPVVAVTSVIRDRSGTDPLGVLVAILPVSHLSVTRDLGTSERSIHIFDHAGHALAPGDPSRSFASHPAVAPALAGRLLARELSVPGRSGPRLAAAAPVPGLGWAVLVEQDRGSAYGPVGGVGARLAAISGLVIVAGVVSIGFGSRLVRRLDRERSRSSAILASIADGVVTVDADGRVTTINPAMERLTGWSEEEVRGCDHIDAFCTFDEKGQPVPREQRIVMKALATGAPVATQGYGLSLLTRDGRRVPVSIAAAPILDHSGKVLGGVSVTRDISRELEMDQLRSALVSTVSHELRTPLTMIRGFAELLISRDLAEEQSREALRQIHVSAERLSRLIDDLLSVSRIESGRVVVRAVPVELEHAIREATAGLPPDRAAQVELDGASTVLADPDMLVQILTNLVSNAVKYSPPATPVFISAHRRQATVEISVRDEGIGLSDTEMERLFEKFFRADRPEVRGAGGTGLGLYITKNLVELQGGQIWVRTEPGHGSTFIFTLPAPGSHERN